MRDMTQAEAAIRAMRMGGASYRTIARAVGISYSFVWRICKRIGVPPLPVENRGRWRRGRKGASPAQIISHAKPENVITLLERHGHNEAGRILRDHRRTVEKMRFWGMAS